jgi:predicted nucleotide-binding protein (sugar kinase/HSP70/actin superfamily)
MKSVTIRISEKDKIKLEALSKAIGSQSLGKTFAEVIRFVDERKDEFITLLKKNKKEDPMVTLLREARGKYEKTSAKKIKEYLYGE